MTASRIILIVEDDDMVSSVLEEGLTDAGFEVEIVNTAEMAITRLDNNGSEYNALLTDVNLAGDLTGWDVAKHARTINPKLPIIYMTGASADEWPSMGVPNSQVMPKPFAIAQVVTAVSIMINAAANSLSSEL